MPASAFPNSTASVSICRSKGWNGRLERNDGEVLEVIAKSSRHPAVVPRLALLQGQRDPALLTALQEPVEALVAELRATGSAQAPVTQCSLVCRF